MNNVNIFAITNNKYIFVITNITRGSGYQTTINAMLPKCMQARKQRAN